MFKPAMQSAMGLAARTCARLGAFTLLCTAGVQAGCGTQLKEKYYLMAMDRSARVANVYRIELSSCTSASKVKYSVGLYDRRAVDRLFGESVMTQEHLDTEISKYNAKTGQRIDDLSVQIQSARLKSIDARISELVSANATVAQLVGTYRTKIDINKEYQAKYGPILDKVEENKKQAQTALEGFQAAANVDAKQRVLLTAEALLTSAAAALQVLRVAIDGKAMVRFFDGSGQLLDTENRKLVIFVATDVGRFSEALRQLVESEETTNDILKVALSERAQQERALKAQVKASDRAESTLVKHLDGMTEEIDWTTAPTQKSVRELLLRVATTAAGKVGTFTDDADIKTYVQGRAKP